MTTMFINELTLIAFTAFIASFAILYLIKSYAANRKLPPGPCGLPFLGYTPFLTLKPHLKLTEIAKKYGNVFSLKLGTKNVVFLNDWDSVKEAFSKDELLARPEDFFVNGLTDNADNITTGSGQFWKEHRRFALRVFRDLGFGKQTMETNIKDEITSLLKNIDDTIDNPINIHDLLIPSVSNNICYFLFGHRFDYDDPLRRTMDFILANVPQIFQIPIMLSYLPLIMKFTKLFGGSQLKEMQAKIKEFEKLMDVEIKSHESVLEENDAKDYFNAYLMEMKRRSSKNENDFFTKGVLNSNSIELIGAGSETVRTTLDWLLKHIAFNTDIQRAVQSEVDSVIGSDRFPSWSDREFMPLTQAVILETLRWASILPINIPRKTTGNTTISRHFIPKNTVVVANFWAINRDPKLWENPDSFNPYRFLSKDGKLITIEALVPFSYGKRSCVGETLAKFELFLYFATLMQKYTISYPNGVKPSFDSWLGISLQPSQIPILQFKIR